MCSTIRNSEYISNKTNSQSTKYSRTNNEFDRVSVNRDVARISAKQIIAIEWGQKINNKKKKRRNEPGSHPLQDE